ncbi:hypothetical protein GCM10010532_096140 [Dactylosporangium siamense]|uniref:Uncharacterized protein n=1 Tax=Dactylosporangium siamense TaxID=685454 RepID=A0A919PTI9_9ACTN|nr:hypothetical protein Dsi01nite_079500 [Dactylosporangium siamense]
MQRRTLLAEICALRSVTADWVARLQDTTDERGSWTVFGRRGCTVPVEDPSGPGPGGHRTLSQTVDDDAGQPTRAVLALLGAPLPQRGRVDRVLRWIGSRLERAAWTVALLRARRARR